MLKILSPRVHKSLNNYATKGAHVNIKEKKLLNYSKKVISNINVIL